MRLLTLALMTALVVTGCSNPKPKAAPSAASAPDAQASQLDAKVDIGDAEYNIACVVTIAPEHRDSNITVQELRDYKRKLSMVTVDVVDPVPSSLPITCSINSTMDFPENPVALKGRVFREITPGNREEIGSFNAVAGAKAMALPKREGQPDATWQFDALQGLSTAPESMLITAELTMLMTASGTQESTIDPNLTQVSAEFTTVEVSNPVRINLGVTPAATPVN